MYEDDSDYCAHCHTGPLPWAHIICWDCQNMHICSSCAYKHLLEFHREEVK